MRAASFVITSAVDEKPLYDPREITTDFRILRAPPDAGPLLAHPGSGMVFPGR